MMAPTNSSIQKAAKKAPKPPPTFAIKKDTGVTKPGKKPVAAKKPAKTAAASAPKSTPAQEYYTEDGLNIPLYRNGKRITNARDGRNIAHKGNKDVILDTLVKAYAGEEIVAKMRKEEWSNADIGDWIAEVETKAIGAGPKGKTKKERYEEKKAMKAQGQPKEIKTTTAKTTEAPPSPQSPREDRVTRSMSSEMRSMWDMVGMDVEDTMPKATPKKQLARKNSAFAPKATLAQDKTTSGIIVSIPNDGDRKRKAPSAEPQPAPKKPKTNPAPTSQAPPTTAKPSKAPQAQTSMPPPSRKPDPTHPPQARKNPPAKKDPADTWTWDLRNTDLVLPKVRAPSFNEQHPLLPVVALDPLFTPTPDKPITSTPVRVLQLPGPQQHMIIAATSYMAPGDINPSATIHVLGIPHKDVVTQARAAAMKKPVVPLFRRKRKTDQGVSVKVVPEPFLKPGKHGYDFENHRWGFEGDRDLQVRVGHQVDPKDAEAFEKGEMSQEDYFDKYPGRRGDQWPCGCLVPGEDDDSEEE